MIIIGAKGHAKEVLGVLLEQDFKDDLYFFDDVSPDAPEQLFGRFPIVRTQQGVRELLKKDPRFVLGIGSPVHRSNLAAKFQAWGGEVASVISASASIGKFNVVLGAGLNVMAGAVITNDISLGQCTLINTHCSIHHDVSIGEYCELSPGCRILGRARVGDRVSIGAGAIVLPDTIIGDNAVIGAGAVVTRNVASGQKVKGVPAR
jgi:sugar O-acyltransferase (sialic acid O-acetyltransferase NeuD family)